LPGVTAAATDGDGGWFVERHLGKPAAGAGCVAHVRSDGSLDPAWRTSLPMHRCEGGALLRRGRRLYVGGRVPTAAGGRRRPLVALNARTGAVLSWAPSLPSGVSVRDIAASRGVLFVRYQRRAYPLSVGVVALDERTGTRLNWQPSRAVLHDPDDPKPQMRSLAAGNGVVYIGLGARVLALDARSAGLVWRTKPLQEGTLGILVVGRNALYASGWHTGMSRIDRATGRVLAIKPRLRGVAAAVGRSDSTIYAVSSVEWGWHNWDDDAATTPSTRPATAIDDRTGRLRDWKPALAPWTEAGAVVPGRSGVLVVGSFRQDA